MSLVTTKKPPWNCTDEDRWLAYVEKRLDEEGIDLPEYKAMLHGLRRLVSSTPTGQGHNPEAARLPPEEALQAQRRAERRYWREIFHRLDVSAARRQSLTGNLEPLRKLLPGAGDCVREPPFDQGQTRLHRQRAIHQEDLARAAADVDPIRKILRQDFHDQSRQAITQKARELAALRNSVNANELAEAMRRGTKRV